jgi:hypothetical protein
MNDEPETQSPRVGPITVESDWITTVGALVVFVACCVLLLSEVEHFLGGRFAVPHRPHYDFFSIFTKVYEVIAGVLCFTVALNYANKPVKTGLVLMGVNLTGAALLSYLPLSSAAFRLAVTSRSIMSQIALTIFILAIAQWLRSVVKRVSSAGPRGGDN